jgi:hypothetical protein
MAYVDRHWTIDPFVGHIGISMHPETRFDARETAIWLKDLLRHIHRKVYWTASELGFYHSQAMFSAETFHWHPTV